MDVNDSAALAGILSLAVGGIAGLVKVVFELTRFFTRTAESARMAAESLSRLTGQFEEFASELRHVVGDHERRLIELEITRSSRPTGPVPKPRDKE